MADQIKTDDPFDIELRTNCSVLDSLKREITVFSNTAHSLPPKERARLVIRIQETLKSLSRFLEKSTGEVPVNAGIKFRFENFKQTLGTIKLQWKKIEGKDERAAIAKEQPVERNPIDTVVERSANDYRELLKSMGTANADEVASAFKHNLGQALDQARKKTGCEDFEVSIQYESNKIKVKIIPKT